MTIKIDENRKIYKRAEVSRDSSHKEKMFRQVVRGIELVLEESQVSISEIKGIGVDVLGKVGSKFCNPKVNE